MNSLPSSTQRRLQKIPQVPSIWEGDRRLASSMADSLDVNSPDEECILWVDGSEGIVRAMEVVSPAMGHEAVVRALLRAIETPMGPSMPERPQKIIVRDREIQFFLRGALQELNITIDYAPNLPVIDELFRNFEEFSDNHPPNIPPQYAELLEEIADEIVEVSPWELLSDRNIIQIQLNAWGVESLYASVLGMLGKEYGVLLYRSLDSLRKFRQSVLEEESPEALEKAFLEQDCWFLTFEVEEDEEDEDEDDITILDEFIEYNSFFGSLHPYEGMRAFLDEEEALAIYTALQAFLHFVDAQEEHLDEDILPPISESYSILLPPSGKKKKGFAPQESLSVTVSTMPEFERELVEMFETTALGNLSSSMSPLTMPLQDNLVPDNALITLGACPWEWVAMMEKIPRKYYQSGGAIPVGDGLPVIIIQTSRPKAQVMIEQILDSEGLAGIGFNFGEDPLEGLIYELGLLQMNDGEIQIFGEFMRSDTTHENARRKWDARCEKTGGYCGLLIASGATGASRGKPTFREMMALFETEVFSPKDLGMGVLRLTQVLDFDLD